MRTIALSKRDIYFGLLKEGEDEALGSSISGAMNNFISGMSHNLKAKGDFLSRPFEIALSTVGPFLITKSVIGWGLWELARHVGFPDIFGWIGSIIDKLLGFGDPENIPAVSESKLNSASETAADRVWDWIKSKWDKLLEMISGVFSLSSRDDIIIKEANKPRRYKRFYRQIMSGGRLSISNLIYKVIFTIFIALLGSAAFSGIFKAVGLGAGPDEKKNKQQETIQKGKTENNLQHYENIKHNVEDTLLEYMNVAVKKRNQYDFETGFEMLRHYPLRGSKEMGKILKDISVLYNYTPIEQINKFKSFFAPNVVDLIIQLMPEARLATKNDPIKQKSAPISKKVKVDPKKELKQLLKGVFDD